MKKSSLSEPKPALVGEKNHPTNISVIVNATALVLDRRH